MKSLVSIFTVMALFAFTIPSAFAQGLPDPGDVSLPDALPGVPTGVSTGTTNSGGPLDPVHEHLPETHLDGEHGPPGSEGAGAAGSLKGTFDLPGWMTGDLGPAASGGLGTYGTASLNEDGTVHADAKVDVSVTIDGERQIEMEHRGGTEHNVHKMLAPVCGSTARNLEEMEIARSESHTPNELEYDPLRTNDQCRNLRDGIESSAWDPVRPDFHKCRTVIGYEQCVGLGHSTCDVFAKVGALRYWTCIGGLFPDN